MVKEYNGRLAGYFETGLEGMVWALEQDGVEGDAGLLFIEEGDEITIYSSGGEQVYSGVIKPDKLRGQRRRPSSTCMQPQALGVWIHWAQESFEPDEWASYFMSNKYSAKVLRCS